MTLIVGATLRPPETVDPDHLAERVRLADRAGLGFVLFADAPDAPAGGGDGWAPDPIETASYAAALTMTVGLVVEAATTHAEPFHLSNRLSSLDWGSRGRAGWLATIDSGPGRAAAHSAPPPDRDGAGREAAEVIDAVRALWDSWSDGALIAEAATGRFLDNTKLHYVDAGREFFTIRGPALMPRPPQGQPPIFGDEPVGVDLPLARVGTEQLRSLPPSVRAAAVDDLDALVDALPGLIADGVVAAPAAGSTLRERLGLARPASRYAEVSA